jgi:hypothetical protein
MTIGATDFVRRLIAAVPELDEVYRQHVIEYDELLPHVLMGDVTRFAIANVGLSGIEGSLSKLLVFLEDELVSSDREISELIGVSFIENLCGERDAMDVLFPRMGKALRKEALAIWGDQ